MATEDELRAYVGAPEGDDYVGSCLATAQDMVYDYINAGHGGDPTMGPNGDVPGSVERRAVLEVAAELFHRRQAPGGITQFATIDGPSPVRMARNPMQAAYPLLDPYLKAGLA